MVFIGVLLSSHLFVTETLKPKQQFTFDWWFDLPLPLV